MSESKERFSKDKVRGRLERRIAQLKDEHGFDPNNGWSQVDGKGEATNRAYGEYWALRDMLRELEL